ncbi:OmpA family protein [uncultured Croceitalea sp.]|uniref:OmpA family protein n=1 Tax=uncultured Croceitalea sp. TaxID=1798908 RepID=UPI003305FA8B
MYGKVSRFISVMVFGLILTTSISAQNLILNPSFENYKACPSKMASFTSLLEDVSLPNTSSGDYYNACGSTDFGVPANFKGNQAAADGNGYTGLYFYALNNYREYVQLNTSRTLREKHPYKVSLQVSLAEASTIALKGMSIVVSNKKLRIPNSLAVTNSRMDLEEGFEFYQVPLKVDRSLSDTEGWVTLTAEFDGKGFENHIIVGNFKDNETTQLLGDKKVTSSDFSYYYIDNLVLEELPRLNYEKDKIYVLESKPFEPKGYELDAAAVASVKKIYKFLKENAEVQMKITGHSNDAGNPEYNKFISSLRARAVALYLKKLGINDQRIVWEGVGETKPLRNGKLSEDKMKKGQVEFVMTNFEDQ